MLSFPPEIVTCSYSVDETVEAAPVVPANLRISLPRMESGTKSARNSCICFRGLDGLEAFGCAGISAGTAQFAYLIFRVVIDGQIEFLRQMIGFPRERCAEFSA